jgi:hypothetical protein
MRLFCGLDEPVMLAHGGATGLVFEAIFLVVPVVIFGTLALISRRKNSDHADGNHKDDKDDKNDRDIDDELGAGW